MFGGALLGYSRVVVSSGLGMLILAYLKPLHGELSYVYAAVSLRLVISCVVVC